eukprot:1156440-Pelagomonas_calceolata.AAC.7
METSNQAGNLRDSQKVAPPQQDGMRGTPSWNEQMVPQGLSLANPFMPFWNEQMVPQGLSLANPFMPFWNEQMVPQGLSLVNPFTPFWNEQMMVPQGLSLVNPFTPFWNEQMVRPGWFQGPILPSFAAKQEMEIRVGSGNNPYIN